MTGKGCSPSISTCTNGRDGNLRIPPMQNLRETYTSLTERQRWWLGGGLAAVLLLFVVVLIVSGSGDPSTDTTASTLPPTTTTIPVSTTSTSTTSTTSTSTTTTLAAGERWPLTGLIVEEDNPPAPILAVKIDNSITSRPQDGLESADLVFDIPVEGGISRLLAFFQSKLPAEIGPVRSVREVDPKLLAPFGAFVAYSGGTAPVVASVLDVAFDLGHPALGNRAYRRAPDRPAPYDLMLDPEAALNVVDGPVGAGGSWLSFGDPGVGQPARTVEIESSARHQVTYGYSAADGGYLRFHDSQPHEVASGVQVVATNLVVVVVEQLETGRTDSSGAPVPDFDVLGSGEAVVFREGTATVGRWERGRLIDFFRLFDSSGIEINLGPGSTWIHLVPVGRTVEWR